MAADDFTLLPTWVKPPQPPKYVNIITKTETGKKDYTNLSSDPEEIYTLEFQGLSDANTKIVRDHYKARYGGYDDFAWKNAYIPDYIIALLGLTTNDLTGRWVDNSLKITPNSKYYDVTIQFIKNQVT